jgi:hypothetical protein
MDIVDVANAKRFFVFEKTKDGPKEIGSFDTEEEAIEKIKEMGRPAILVYRQPH